MKKYITPMYTDLIDWRDYEIKEGNMEKAKKIHTLSRKYKFSFYN